MTDRLWLILIVAAVTYATRLTGFALAGRTLPAPVGRFLAYVPAATFAALVAPGIAVGGELTPRLLGAAVAAGVVLRLRQLWAGLVTGMAAYWLVRTLLGG